MADTAFRVIQPGDARTISLPGITMQLMITSDMTGGALFMAEEETAPRGGPPLHIHHQQTEIFRVLHGLYRFQAGDQTAELAAGGMLIVPPGTPHAFMNISDGPSRLQFSLTPAIRAEQAFGRLDDIAKSGGPPDPAQFNAEMVEFGIELVGPPLAAMEPS